jgi:signal transduction histidine kinase
MPDLDFHQLLFQARECLPELAVVSMTGYGTLDIAVAALKEGVDGLILKPFTQVEMIENIRHALVERERKSDELSLQALQPLFEAVETLFQDSDLSRLKELIVDLICVHLNCSYAGLFKKEPETGSCEALLSKGGNNQIAIQISESDLLRDLMENGEPLLIRLGRSCDQESENLLHDYQLNSLMCVPVLCQETVYNLVAARFIGDHPFRQADLGLFQIMARLSARALENARLCTELQSTIRQLEKSRNAVLQAEKIAAAGRLTASIAHEINNPLQSLNNFLHLAMRKELVPAERERYLEMARLETERLFATAQRMLDFFRPGARDPQRENLHTLIERVLGLLEHQLKDLQIIVHCSFAPDLPEVMVVASQIQQVLINLMLNSMQAMPGGGELFIMTTSHPGRVEILLEDTGPGIPEHERNFIFEPFATSKENGTGLGLAVSSGILAAHGGALNLAEGRGRGACFRITLPKEEINES